LNKLGFETVEAFDLGRPGYHPCVHLKLYIYGYLNRVQSSRRLERECQRNLEVMLLTGRLAPERKTIADFRKDNGQAIKKVCAQFVELCRRMASACDFPLAQAWAKASCLGFLRAAMRCRKLLGPPCCEHDGPECPCHAWWLGRHASD
jgi:hypothetical protein